MGGILAFLWFNIPPARFYMGETGILGLTTALTVVAFLTDTVAVLPIIAFPLFAASGSSVLQIFSKKYLGRKNLQERPPSIITSSFGLAGLQSGDAFLGH